MASRWTWGAARTWQFIGARQGRGVTVIIIMSDLEYTQPGAYHGRIPRGERHFSSRIALVRSDREPRVDQGGVRVLHQDIRHAPAAAAVIQLIR